MTRSQPMHTLVFEDWCDTTLVDQGLPGATAVEIPLERQADLGRGTQWLL